MACALGRERPEVLVDEPACEPVLILKPGKNTGEILAGEQRVGFQAVCVPLRLGPGKPTMRTDALLAIKLVKELRDSLDVLGRHDVALLFWWVLPPHCSSIPL